MIPIDPADRSNEWVNAIAEELEGDDRSPERIRDIAERWGATESFVAAVTAATEGRTMTKSTPRAQAMAAAVKLHGTGPKAIAVIRRVLGVSEAQASDYARRIAESAATSSTGAPGTSAARATSSDFDAELAAATGGRTMAQLSTAELAALADHHFYPRR